MGLKEGDPPYELRQALRKANAALRDAEDIARLAPMYRCLPTADRIRSIHEQVTEDVLNGRSTRKPLLEQLRIAEDALLWLATELNSKRARRALEEMQQPPEPPCPPEVQV